MTASRDLGGLGAEQGPPFTYHGRGWDLLPPLLPWLALVGLSALKPNRRWSAWWVWLPLACIALCVTAGWQCVAPGLRELRSVPWLKQVLGVLFDVPLALAFGVAALSLLVPCLDCSQRFGTGLRVLVVLAGLSAGSFAVAGLWNEGVGEAALPLLSAGSAGLERGRSRRPLGLRLPPLSSISPLAVVFSVTAVAVVCAGGARLFCGCGGLSLAARGAQSPGHSVRNAHRGDLLRQLIPISDTYPDQPALPGEDQNALSFSRASASGRIAVRLKNFLDDQRHQRRPPCAAAIPDSPGRGGTTTRNQPCPQQPRGWG